MKLDDAVEIFGSKDAVAKAIGISPSAVYQWGSDIPKSRRQSVRLAMREKANELEKQAARLRADSEVME